MNDEEFIQARHTAAQLRYSDTAGHIYLTKALARIEELEIEVNALKVALVATTSARGRAVSLCEAASRQLDEVYGPLRTVGENWDGCIRDTSDDNPLWNALDELARIGRRLM